MMKHKTKLIGICLATLMLVSVIAMTGVVSAAPTTARTTARAVSAAPKVKAASDSGVAVWDTNVIWGLSFGGCAVSSQDGQVYVADDMAQAGGPAWASIGKPAGTIMWDPSVVDDGFNLYVFVSMTDGSIWMKEVWDTGPWIVVQNWQQVGGVTCAQNTGPGAFGGTINNAWQVGLFYVGQSNELRYTYHPPGGAWSAPQDLGGYVTASPGAVSRVNDGISVFVRGQSGLVWAKEYSTGAFGPWYQVPGYGYLEPNTGPMPIADSPHSMKLYVAGGSGQMYYQVWDQFVFTSDVGYWNVARDNLGVPVLTTGYTLVGGQLTASPGVCYSPTWAGNEYPVAIRGGNMNIWWTTGTPPSPFPGFGGWAQITNLP